VLLGHGYLLARHIKIELIVVCPLLFYGMNGRKTAYDNAVAESFFSNIKNEWVHHHDFKSREEAGLAIFDYIECFYNTQRLHQSLGYLTPVEMEKRYDAQMKSTICA
jgi:transposase InsO family protein